MDLRHPDSAANVISLYPLVLLQCPRCFDVGPPRWVGPDPRPNTANHGIMVRTCGRDFHCAGCMTGYGCLETKAYCYGCSSKYRDESPEHGWQSIHTMFWYQFPKNMVLAFTSS
jgi:hypothetical protein